MIKSLISTTYNKLKRKGDSSDEKDDVNRSCDYSGDYQFDGNHHDCVGCQLFHVSGLPGGKGRCLADCTGIKTQSKLSREL